MRQSFQLRESSSSAGGVAHPGADGHRRNRRAPARTGHRKLGSPGELLPVADFRSAPLSPNRSIRTRRGLDALERDYVNTRAKYQEMKSKQLQAELSQNLEQDQKGERFTLLEPPLRPDKPVKPNRPKLLMLGLALSMVGGLGVAGLAESVDGGIRGARALASVTQMMPLATIPYISIPKDAVRRKRRVKIALIAIFLLGIAFVCAVHFFYKPLDLLWFIVLRKLNLA